jgi:hypothetical protein
LNFSHSTLKSFTMVTLHRLIASLTQRNHCYTSMLTGQKTFEVFRVCSFHPSQFNYTATVLGIVCSLRLNKCSKLRKCKIQLQKQEPVVGTNRQYYLLLLYLYQQSLPTINAFDVKQMHTFNNFPETMRPCG